jgi:phenylacetate-CoA ligase
MRRFDRITGRSDDMLIIRGVNVFPSQIEELIRKDQRLAPHYVLEVRRDDRLDVLDVVVEPRPDLAGDVAARRQAGDRLAHDIKAFIGVTATVRVADVGKVERSIGKAKRVIDLRPKG